MPALSPSQLENLIEVYRMLGTHEPDTRRARDAFERMRELIAERTPERIEEMERERGLRA